MKKDTANKAAWIGLLGVVLAAVIAGVFSMVPARKDPRPVPPVLIDQEKHQGPDTRIDPTADYVIILNSRFDTTTTGQLYIGGNVRVGYFGKGSIQSSILTSCLAISKSSPCSNINLVRIGTGVHDYLFSIDDPLETENERMIVLCIGDQTRIFNYLNTELRDRTMYDQPVCATTTVKR